MLQKGWLLLTVVCSLVIFSACQSKESLNSEDANSIQGDWPVYTINELAKDSDLIAYVEVTDAKNVDGNPPTQESTLSILQLLKGTQSEKKINLSLADSKYFVVPGNKYIMFLSNKGSHYTQIAFNALLPETSGKFNSTINGMTGEYELKDIETQISSILSSP